MATVKVSRKGWVVIPRDIRDRHGIRPGDEVQIVDYAGRIAIIPASADPIRETRGFLRQGASLTRALLDERRAQQQREEAALPDSATSAEKS